VVGFGCRWVCMRSAMNSARGVSQTAESACLYALISVPCPQPPPHTPTSDTRRPSTVPGVQVSAWRGGRYQGVGPGAGECWRCGDMCILGVGFAEVPPHLPPSRLTRVGAAALPEGAPGAILSTPVKSCRTPPPLPEQGHSGWGRVGWGLPIVQAQGRPWQDHHADP